MTRAANWSEEDYDRVFRIIGFTLVKYGGVDLQRALLQEQKVLPGPKHKKWGSPSSIYSSSFVRQRDEWLAKMEKEMKEKSVISVPASELKQEDAAPLKPMQVSAPLSLDSALLDIIQRAIEPLVEEIGMLREEVRLLREESGRSFLNYSKAGFGGRHNPEGEATVRPHKLRVLIVGALNGQQNEIQKGASTAGIASQFSLKFHDGKELAGLKAKLYGKYDYIIVWVGFVSHAAEAMCQKNGAVVRLTQHGINGTVGLLQSIAEQ